MNYKLDHSFNLEGMLITVHFALVLRDNTTGEKDGNRWHFTAFEIYYLTFFLFFLESKTWHYITPKLLPQIRDVHILKL